MSVMINLTFSLMRIKDEAKHTHMHAHVYTQYNNNMTQLASTSRFLVPPNHVTWGSNHRITVT